MYSRDGKYYMALRHPVSNEYIPFEIAHVIGYQYRQVYVTREANGVLRRLPLQWSTRLQAYFPYWNLQEGSTPTLEDLWAKMRSQNSAWNLYCARCHTTNSQVLDKDAHHTRVDTKWVDAGISCEACLVWREHPMHAPNAIWINPYSGRKTICRSGMEAPDSESTPL